MSHTPGPWFVDDASGHKYSVNTHQRHVALVSCFNNKPGAEEENIANAKLIAAAPTLLEALIDGERIFRKQSNPEDEVAWLAQARAAIERTK